MNRFNRGKLLAAGAAAFVISITAGGPAHAHGDEVHAPPVVSSDPAHDWVHDRLGRQHDRTHDRLDRQHEIYHYFNGNRNNLDHELFHRQQERQHNRVHRRLNRQHHGYHYSRGYGGYGYGQSGWGY